MMCGGRQCSSSSMQWAGLLFTGFLVLGAMPGAAFLGLGGSPAIGKRSAIFDVIGRKGDLLPGDSYVLVGENVTLRCRLDENRRPAGTNASDLRITPGDNVASKQGAGEEAWGGAWGRAQLRVVSELEVELLMVGVTHDDEGAVYCKLADSTYVASGTISVGEMPEIGDMKCISHNHQDLNCSFCPDDYPPELFTFYEITYSSGNTEASFLCENKTATCYCAIDSIMPHQYFEFHLKFGNHTFVDGIRSWEAVKADPVIKFKTDIGSRSVNGSFEKATGAKHLDMVFTVYATTELGLENHSLYLGSNTTFELEDLHPFTPYNLSVINQVRNSPHRSDPAIIEITTLAEAPASGPPMPPGAMKLGEECKAANCHVNYFFYEVIPPLEELGPISGYVVTVSPPSLREGAGAMVGARRWARDGAEEGEEVVDVGKSSTFAASLDDSTTYTVCVKAYNDVSGGGGGGEEEGERLYSPTSCVTRPPLSQLPGGAEVWVERRENTIIVHVTSVPEDATSITLFRCKTLDHDPRQCEEPIESVELAANTTRYEQQHEVRYEYSVSANTHNASSGMTPDWLCYYAYDKGPGSVEEFTVAAPQERSLSASWLPQICKTNNAVGKILDYDLTWTCDSGEEGKATVAGEASGYVITGLEPATRCDVTLMARARYGNHTTTSTALTRQSRPDMPPQNVLISNISSTGFLVTYQPTPLPNGDVTHYVIRITDENNVTENHVTTELEYIVDDLFGFMNYRVSVAAENIAGLSPFSAPIQAQTFIGAPSAVREVSAEKSEAAAEVLVVRWVAPLHWNGPASRGGYRVLVTPTHDSHDAPPQEHYTNATWAEIAYHGCVNDELRVNVSVHAVNVDEAGAAVIGEPPDPAPAPTYVCKDNPIEWIAGGISLFVVCLVFVIIVAYRCCKKKASEYLEKLPVVVPEDDKKDDEQKQFDSGYPAPLSEDVGSGSKFALPPSRENSDSGHSGSISSDSTSVPPSPSSADSDGYASAGEIAGYETPQEHMQENASASAHPEMAQLETAQLQPQPQSQIDSGETSSKVDSYNDAVVHDEFDIAIPSGEPQDMNSGCASSKSIENYTTVAQGEIDRGDDMHPLRDQLDMAQPEMAQPPYAGSIPMAGDDEMDSGQTTGYNDCAEIHDEFDIVIPSGEPQDINSGCASSKSIENYTTVGQGERGDDMHPLREQLDMAQLEFAQPQPSQVHILMPFSHQPGSHTDIVDTPPYAGSIPMAGDDEMDSGQTTGYNDCAEIHDEFDIVIPSGEPQDINSGCASSKSIENYTTVGQREIDSGATESSGYQGGHEISPFDVPIGEPKDINSGGSSDNTSQSKSIENYTTVGQGEIDSGATESSGYQVGKEIPLFDIPTGEPKDINSGSSRLDEFSVEMEIIDSRGCGLQNGNVSSDV